MRDINPFLILASLAVLFIVVLKEHSIQKERISSAILEYKENLKLAKSIKNLQDIWQNKAYSKRELKSLLNSGFLKDAKVSTISKSDGESVKIEDLKARVSDAFVNRLLNSRLKIKKLKIKRDSNSSLNLEFKVEY